MIENNLQNSVFSFRVVVCPGVVYFDAADWAGEGKAERKRREWGSKRRRRKMEQKTWHRETTSYEGFQSWGIE